MLNAARPSHAWRACATLRPISQKCSIRRRTSFKAHATTGCNVAGSLVPLPSAVACRAHIQIHQLSPTRVYKITTLHPQMPRLASAAPPPVWLLAATTASEDLAAKEKAVRMKTTRQLKEISQSSK